MKPFQIRDFRVSPQEQTEQPEEPEQPGDSGSTPGVVQISAADYDDLASNHPRARLTYVDEDDDDETITVSLHLMDLSVIVITLTTFLLGWIRTRTLPAP